MTILIAILIAFVGVVLSAVCSGVETGLYVINRVRLAVWAGRGDAAAVRMENEIERPERLLSTLLILNNAANYAGNLGVALFLSVWSLSTGSVVVLNTLLVVPLLFVFAETVPKDLFRIHADRWLPRFSGAMSISRRVLTCVGVVPLLSLVSVFVSRIFGGGGGDATTPRARMTRLIRESAETGSLSAAQLDLADRALSMRSLSVATEMIPWRQVVSIPTRRLAEDARLVARSTMRSRLPVVGEEGRVIGVVGVQDLLLGRRTGDDAIDRGVARLRPDSSIFTALETLRRDRCPVGIVEDADGRPLGLVTLKDLVEPLLGELSAW